MNALWLDYVRVGWPILSALSAFLLLVLVLWLRTKFTPIDEHQRSCHRLTDLEAKALLQGARLDRHETLITQAPSRQALQDDISDLSSRMSGVETGLRGIGRQLDSQNNYLRDLIDRSGK